MTLLTMTHSSSDADQDGRARGGLLLRQVFPPPPPVSRCSFDTQSLGIPFCDCFLVFVVDLCRPPDPTVLAHSFESSRVFLPFAESLLVPAFFSSRVFVSSLVSFLV